MKKIVSLLVAIILTVTTVALADNREAEKLQEVLLLVKQKIDIPSELTEFDSEIRSYKGETTYRFEWYDENHTKSVSVVADEKGRIKEYYNRISSPTKKRLSDYSQEEVLAFVEDFMQRAFPEAFSDSTDVLVFNRESYSVGDGTLRYTITYDRYKNSVKVKNNSIGISVIVNEKGELELRSMNSTMDYDTDFEKENREIPDVFEKYKEKFPIELVYFNDYNTAWKSESDPIYIPTLIYRNKDGISGYISVETGEIVKEEEYTNTIYRAPVADSSMESTNKKEAFTEKELAEISTVEGFISTEEIEKKFKELPYVVFPEDLTLVNNYVSATDTKEEYNRSLRYSNEKDDDYGYLSLTANAKDGKIVNYRYNEKYEDRKDINLSEAEENAVREKAEKFLTKAAESEFKNTRLESIEEQEGYVRLYYYRDVNGIKHINEGISVTFDGKKNYVNNYDLNFTKGDLPDSSDVVGEKIACENLYNYAPVIKQYIKSGGKYILCAGPEKQNVILYAKSGDIKNKSYEKSYFDYNDIKGHWVQEAATKLSEIQIGFSGGKLLPDNSVTQEEFLRFTASGIYGKYYNTLSQESLYENLIRDKIVLKEEKNPEAFIPRADAFVFLIRMMNLEKVAQLKDIYKTDFADSNLIENGRIGYCAILSGMGIICGDGGYVRPTDNLTRAEAVMIVYRSLMTI